nr:MAG TPA: hypothetical protein [Bacteriophage sp.]
MTFEFIHPYISSFKQCIVPPFDYIVYVSICFDV